MSAGLVPPGPKGRFLTGHLRELRAAPERWADGLERRLPKGAYFPFGGGPRVCIGNHFAMLEAVLVLATVAQNWSFSIPPGEPAVRPRPMITLRPAGPVNLTLHARRPKQQ
jgi:cytochrome P450